MPTFNVSFSTTAFKEQPDGSKFKVLRALGSFPGILAENQQQAIAIAGRWLDAKVDDEILAVATIEVK